MERITQVHPDIRYGQRPKATLLSASHRTRNLRREPEPSGILAIHASAVCTNSGALIFLGPSGSGKSTIRKLLSTGTQPLADDKVYIVPRNGHGWIVADATSRILEGPLLKEEAAVIQGPPLRAIVRLYQAPETYLMPVDVVETCRHLINAFFELLWQQHFDVESKKDIYAGLTAIVRVIPGYRLYFDPSHQVQEVLSQGIDH